jgi:hypothetical protein
MPFPTAPCSRSCECGASCSWGVGTGDWGLGTEDYRLPSTDYRLPSPSSSAFLRLPSPVHPPHLPTMPPLKGPRESRVAPRCRAIAACLLGFISALAFSPAGGQGPGARVMLPGYELPILLDTLAIVAPVAGSREAIFEALSHVFAELEIRVEEKDASTGLLRNLGVQKSRRLGKVALSKYFDCGRGFSGANADVYRITIALSAWVEPPAGTAEKLHIAVVGSGQDPAGSRSGFVKCNSTGALEAFIAGRVRTRVATRTERDNVGRPA